MKPIRLLLVDDQSLFREALRTLLSLQSDFEVVGEAENGLRAVDLARDQQPDVILMDLRMPVLGGSKPPGAFFTTGRRRAWWC
jgi:DNA-binding NarL/FixJ family response regulator